MRILTALGALCLTGCSAATLHQPLPALITPSAQAMLTPSQALAAGERQMPSVEAVIMAASAMGAGVRGVMILHVRRAEQVGPRFFLNSQADYRDQRSLAVAITPWAMPELRARFGGDLRRAFLGKDIRVFGFARRERIDFTVNGRRTGKYYYQTHVAVTDARQIEVR